MAGYSSSSEVNVVDLNGWVLADAESMPSSVSDAAIPEADGQKLGVDVALAFPVLPATASKLEVVLSVLAPTAQGTARAPLRLVAVLDKSGSMQGEKLRLVIETVKFMLQHLSERDALGLIAFDTHVQVLAPLTHCTAEGRAHLELVIGRLKSGTQTNLSGGILRGLELHQDAVHHPDTLSNTLQRIHFGNKYKRLSQPLQEAAECDAQMPAGCERVHEWTMELVTETSADAALIEKVVYKLHDTFADPRVEVFESPFQLTRVGWGIFKVLAEVHLHDGRVLHLEHEICFKQPETMQIRLLPLQPPPHVSPAVEDPQDQMGVIRSTFLFTDGVANVGIQKYEDLCAAVAGMTTELGNKCCTISTFGFGADHSEDLLRKVAETGKGVYCFIENAESIGAAFGEALGGLLSVTHQNVRLCLNLAPGVTLQKARTKYQVDGPTCAIDGGQNMSIDLGDLFAEERRDILLELSMAETANDTISSTKFGCFYAQAFSVLGSCSEKTSPVDLVIERRSDVPTDRVQVHPQVERHRNRHIASEALEAARAKARNGHLSEARQILQAAITELAASSRAAQGCVMTAALLADVQECLGDLQDQRTYTTSGSKKMAYMQMAHEMQRTCGGNTTQTYCNSAGLSMRSAAASACQ